jgi:Flp pilus assembly protein TadG
MRRARRSRRSARGQGLVEFALIFPVLVIVLVAVFDLGRLVFAYNGITNAAREATRTGIVDQTIANIQADAIDQATSLGLTASQVDVKFCKPDGTACSTTKPTTLDALVQVQITYDWQAITPIIGNVVGPVSVTAVSRMPIERVYP